MSLRISRVAVVVCAVSLSIACGKKKADEKDAPKQAPAAAEAKQAEPPAADEAPVPEPPAAPKQTMPTPESLDASKPIPVEDLKAAFFAWKDKEVTVVAYCDAFGSGDAVNRCRKFRGSPDEPKPILRCDLTKSEAKDTVSKTDAVTIKGKVKYSPWDEVELSDCSFVAMGGTPAPDATDASKPISATALHHAIKGYKGMVVQVVGRYHSTTKSTTPNGVSVRVDLTGADGAKAVGCKTKDAAEPPAELTNNRDGVIMKGTIEKESFDNVGLVDCEFVNR